MRHRVAFAALMVAIFAIEVAAETPAAKPAPFKGRDAMQERTAAGTFDVKLVPVLGGTQVGGMTIDKVFHGDLDGTSAGQMLAVRTAVDGSAGYVAMEVVTGALAGRRGTFALQHSGTMNRGVPSLSVSVVPDSGTGDLAGLTGTMTIDVAAGQHKYAFRYALPE